MHQQSIGALLENKKTRTGKTRTFVFAIFSFARVFYRFSLVDLARNTFASKRDVYFCYVEVERRNWVTINPYSSKLWSNFRRIILVKTNIDYAKYVIMRASNVLRKVRERSHFSRVRETVFVFSLLFQVQASTVARPSDTRLQIICGTTIARPNAGPGTFLNSGVKDGRKMGESISQTSTIARDNASFWSTVFFLFFFYILLLFSGPASGSVSNSSSYIRRQNA